MMNCPSYASVSVPFVSGANFREADFTSVAQSGWVFQLAETSAKPGNFDLCVYTGSPVAGVLVVERQDDLSSIQYLTNLGCTKYTLAEVLTVAVEKSGDQFIASEPRRGWYGYGDSEVEAIGSFASGLVEELESLTAREDRLNQHLRDELGQLRSVVIPRR